jgi:hypothetical protein
MDLTRTENQMASDRTSQSSSVGLTLFGIGTVLAIVGAWLLYLAATYTFTGPPTCDGEAMAPGESCLAFRGGTSYGYEQGMKIQESFGMTIRAAGGVLVGGVGAWLLSSGARSMGRTTSRVLYAVAAILLAAVAAYLFTIDAASAMVGAVGAAAAAIRMIVGIGWRPLSGLAVYLAGITALGGAAYLVGQAATYRPTESYGAAWDAPLDVLVADIVNSQGDWLRLVLAVVATVAGWWLITDAAEPEPKSRARYGQPSRPVTAALYLGAALAAGVAGWYLIGVGTVSASVGFGLAVLLIAAFAIRAVRVTRVAIASRGGIAPRGVTAPRGATAAHSG